jgi:tetratricopeptide (TPR) repeat protein
MDDPADQHREVVAEALRILRRLKNDRKKMSIQEGAFDLLDLSMSLDGLEMLEDAEITCTWAANLYRTLVQGNVRTFLPWLAACLLNLTALRDALHNAKGALAASQEAVVVHRMVNDIGSPDSLECLAATLGNHSQVLSRLHYFEESLVAAQESVELLRIKVSGEAELDLEAQDLRASIVDIADSDSESEETSGDKTEMPSMKSVEEIVETPPVLSRLVRLKYALGGALGSLADSLSNTDQDVEAYHASKESMDLFRSICESHPGTFDVVLAGALHRSSFCLSTLRRPLEALPLIEEAANIYRGFAKKRPRSFSNLLISSLCHVATLRRGAGGDEDSFAAANEAVSVYRSLVRNNPNFTLYFPKTFQDIAFQLGMLGRKEEALALITEAVETYRTSISDFPSLLPSFAHGLDHLAQLLYSGNRLEDSLMVNTEAVDVYRTLAKDEPTVWSSHLAGSLARLARSFYENNQHDERIAAGNEIIGLSRTAGKESTFLDALKCLQCAVRGVGRPEVTVPICAEILSIQRIHTGEHPTEYPQSFVESLIAHAVDLNRNDQYLDSITVCKEAISLCRSFGSPDSPHDSDAIRAAYHWANGLMFVGRVVEAISVCQETVTTFQRLVGDRSTSHIARVFSDLFQLLSEGYCVRGQFDKAVAANEKAVSLSRQMPPEHHSELAIALRELSSSLLKASNPKDALQASQEAVEVCRNLPPSESDSSDLAYCLDRHSICLINEGRDDHALTAAQEAINLYQQISPNNTRRERRFDCDVWIAEALYDFAAVLAATGRPADALENTKESASIYRIVVTTRPFYLPQFVTVLRSLAVRLSEAGHEAESIDARKEEVTVTQYLVSTYPDLVPALQHTSDLGVTEEVLGRSDLEAKGNAVDRMEWV